jgi:hypothetical protein
MSPIPFADFLAGSIISLLFPILLLIGIAIWYVVGVRRFEGPPPSPEPVSPGGPTETAPAQARPDAETAAGGPA